MRPTKPPLVSYETKIETRNECLDTEDTFHLRDRIFKKNDAHFHKCNANYVYRIDNLFYDGGKKMGRCTVFRKIKDTLLGPEVQVGIIRHFHFVKYVHPIEIPLLTPSIR